MGTEWLIVIGADATIVAAADGAPADWTTRRVDDEALPAELREAAASLLGDFYRAESGLQTASVVLQASGQPVRLAALFAVPVRRSETNLGDLLASAVDVMKVQAETIEVALALDVAADVPSSVLVDREKIAWAVTAMLGNAFRFIRRGTRLMPGGSIFVRARHDAVAARVIVEIQDDGLGIPEERLRALLQRSPGRLHVTGLGFMLAREIMTAHGGRFDVTSTTESGQSGTTVRFTLPYR